MADTPDLSGRWEGFYLQCGKARPIEAEFVQQGDKLAGEMLDRELSLESSVEEMAMEQGLPPGADESIVEQVRSLRPGLETLPVRAEVLVPRHSDVAGEVDGQSVRFTRTYRGLFFSGYRVGDLRVGVGGEDQEVFFRGRVSGDGCEIEGRWLLANAPPQNLMRTEGGFVLRRVGTPHRN